MRAENFKYDGKLASDFGLMICYVGGAPGEEVISAGSEINFNQVSIRHGNMFLTTDTTYDSPLEATFQVCKLDCSSGFQELTLDEKRKIARWLNRHEPHTLELIDENNEDFSRYIFEGSFAGIGEIFIGNKCVGYELHFISNRPYAIGKTMKRTIEVDTATLDQPFEYKFNDSSDEIGYIYPKQLTITFPEDGGDIDVFELRNYIENSDEGRLTQIKNCVAGETITFTDMLTIETSDENHSKTLQDDFNFCFFRIANSYSNRLNKISISSPCTLKFEYNPAVKGVSL